MGGKGLTIAHLQMIISDGEYLPSESMIRAQSNEHNLISLIGS